MNSYFNFMSCLKKKMILFDYFVNNVNAQTMAEFKLNELQI